MRPGTPQFIGARLRQAREARGLTAIALAGLIDVSRQAISQYENGPETPAPSVMNRISEVLGLPVHFFLRPVDSTGDDETVFYRSMASATKASRIRAESRLDWTRELVQLIRTFVNLPKPNFPAFDLPADPLAIKKSHIEEAAQLARRFWKLGDGPISNIVLLLENNGAMVTRQDLAAETLDAFSIWDRKSQVPFVVLNAEKTIAVRSRFDVAHELAHLVLHRNIPNGCLQRPELFKLIENQAHAFAGAFLLPAKTFAEDAINPSLEGFRSLKAKWKVSIQAMIFRAESLGLLSADRVSRMWPNLSRRGWKKFEPLDDVLEQEQPRLLRRSFDLILERRVTTRREIVAQSALSANLIEELIGLPQRYFDPVADDANEAEPTILRFPAAG